MATYTIWGFPGSRLENGIAIARKEGMSAHDVAFDLDAHIVDPYDLLVVLPDIVWPGAIQFEKNGTPYVASYGTVDDYACWMWASMAEHRQAWLSSTLANALSDGH
jgi:hypothetical protein